MILDSSRVGAYASLMASDAVPVGTPRPGLSRRSRRGHPVASVTSAAAIASLITPLNTSMVPVALEDVRISLGVDTSTAISLLSAFAFASAIAQPVGGLVADRVGPRTVLLAGFLIMAIGVVGAVCARSFHVLVAFRVVQALGGAAGYPAGLALVRGDGAQGVTPWRLGIISTSGNVAAALGPVLGGALLGLWGWRSVFLVNVPLIAVGALVACSVPDRRVHVEERSPVALLAVLRKPILFACAQMMVFCLIFFSVFIGAPLWLLHHGRFGTLQAGLMMLPVATISALATPLAVRAAARWGVGWVLVLGGGSLLVGALLLFVVGHETPAWALTAVIAVFGVPNAFNNLGLQLDLTRVADAHEMGTAGGLLQTARFVGAGLAGAVIGLIFRNDATTEALHLLAIVIGVLGLTLVAVNVRRLAHDGHARRSDRTGGTQ